MSAVASASRGETSLSQLQHFRCELGLQCRSGRRRSGRGAQHLRIFEKLPERLGSHVVRKRGPEQELQRLVERHEPERLDTVPNMAGQFDGRAVAGCAVAIDDAGLLLLEIDVQMILLACYCPCLGAAALLRTAGAAMKCRCAKCEPANGGAGHAFGATSCPRAKRREPGGTSMGGRLSRNPWTTASNYPRPAIDMRRGCLLFVRCYSYRAQSGLDEGRPSMLGTIISVMGGVFR